MFHKSKCKWSYPITMVFLLLSTASFGHLFMLFRMYSSHPTHLISNLQDPYENLHLDLPMENYRDRVYFGGAYWKADVGNWLSRCGSFSSEFDVVETLHAKECRNDCSGMGVCNREIGLCRCRHGYDGEDCSRRKRFPCNLPSTEGAAYGNWTTSICSAHCDDTTAFCYCGEGTAYPNRPVPESCGFQYLDFGFDARRPWEFDYKTPDHESIYSTNPEKLGWCNIDPIHAAPNLPVKEACRCSYDGIAGRFCEITNMATCTNQCSGHGYCHGGFCQCENGWYGVDCSIPSSWSFASQGLPSWLKSSTVDIEPDKGVRLVVKRRRPLVYIYDLPSELDAHFIQGRHDKDLCVTRIYDEKNRTIWTDSLYSAHMALYESLLASPHRTMNSDEADYFYVPVNDACMMRRRDDAPHTFYNEKDDLILKLYSKAYVYITNNYPYWNRTSGRDHIWFFTWDDGPCHMPKEIRNSIILSHWGNTNSKHKANNTHLPPDNVCFDPRKDIVLPSWKSPELVSSSKYWNNTREKREIFFYFNGDLGKAYESQFPEPSYSLGIRQKVAEEFGSVPNKQGKIGRQHTKDVVVTAWRTASYYEEISKSLFCGVFPGCGWSGRLEDSVLNGCIPVIIQDGILSPFETVLDYNSFSIRLSEDDIPNMISILRRINETEIDTKLRNIRKLRPRFLYRDSILHEFERQKKMFDRMSSWGMEMSNIIGDDIFSTLIQVLHYRLHNDPWRHQLNNRRKDHDLQKECARG